MRPQRGRRVLEADDTYGDTALVAEGPRLAAVSISGGAVQVRFTHAGGLRTTDGAAPRGFELADPGGVYQPARARIVDDEVWLECEAGRTACAVRYAWADNPDANLQNGAGLPAAPFRADAFD